MSCSRTQHDTRPLDPESEALTTMPSRSLFNRVKEAYIHDNIPDWLNITYTIVSISIFTKPICNALMAMSQETPYERVLLPPIRLPASRAIAMSLNITDTNYKQNICSVLFRPTCWMGKVIRHTPAARNGTVSQKKRYVAYLSLVVRKPVFGVSDQVRHKPGCTTTQDC